MNGKATYQRALTPTLQGMPALPAPDKIKPQYPSRLPTLLGIKAQAKSGEIRAISESFEVPLLPIKYVCYLKTSKGLLFVATVVTHLSLEDWCDMKGYRLGRLISGPEMALPGERTELG